MSVPASQYGWGTLTDVENLVGTQAVIMWTNPSGVNASSTVNNTVAQSCIQWADAIIYGKFRNQANYAYPLSPFGGGIIIVNNWWVNITAQRLYTSRGLRSAGDYPFQMLYDQAMSEMGEYLSGTKILDAATRWGPQPSGPVAIL